MTLKAIWECRKQEPQREMLESMGWKEFALGEEELFKKTVNFADAVRHAVGADSLAGSRLWNSAEFDGQSFIGQGDKNYYLRLVFSSGGRSFTFIVGQKGAGARFLAFKNHCAKPFAYLKTRKAAIDFLIKQFDN